MDFQMMDQLKKCQTMQTSEFCASIDADVDVDEPCNWIRIYIQLANDCANKVDFIC